LSPPLFRGWGGDGLEASVTSIVLSATGGH